MTGNSTDVRGLASLPLIHLRKQLVDATITVLQNPVAYWVLQQAKAIVLSSLPRVVVPAFADAEELWHGQSG